MRGMNPEAEALKSIMDDASTARLGPSRVQSGSGAAEILRSLGQQLLDEADAMEAGESESEVSVEIEAEDGMD